MNAATLQNLTQFASWLKMEVPVAMSDLRCATRQLRKG
jgi:hypothetical protein